jgi:hypothetical protein
MTSKDVSQNEVDLFISTTRAMGTPWGDGCASLIQKLWAELQERRIEVEKYKAWAASCDPKPPETTERLTAGGPLTANEIADGCKPDEFLDEPREFQDGADWIVQLDHPDYVAAGATLDEARFNFWKGLAMTFWARGVRGFPLAGSSPKTNGDPS